LHKDLSLKKIHAAGPKHAAWIFDGRSKIIGLGEIK